MENSKNTRKQEKQKMLICTRGGGGGGGGPVVVWGGVVAIAALVSVSAISKLRKKPANKRQNPSPPLISSSVESEKLELMNNDKHGKDVSILPRDSSPPIDCYHPRDGITDMSATQLTDSKSSDLTKSLILDDDNPLLDMDLQNESQEERLNDEVTPQVRAEGKAIEVASGDLFVKALTINNTETDMQEMETAMVNQEEEEDDDDDDKAVEATQVGKVETEDNRGDHDIQSIEETVIRKYDEDNETAEKGEESSVERIEENSQLVMTSTEKATDDENEGGEDEEEMTEKAEEETSSTNGEAIWQEQSVEELPVELKEMKINQQKLEADDENEGGETKEEMTEKGEEESEAIWPAQSVEELPVLEHEEMKINQQTLEEREEGDRKVKKGERSCCSYDDSNVKDGDIYHANGNSHHYNQVIKGKPAIKITSLKEVMMRSIFIDPSDLRIWIWSTSMLLLLLVAHLLVSPTPGTA